MWVPRFGGFDLSATHFGVFPERVVMLNVGGSVWDTHFAGATSVDGWFRQPEFNHNVTA